MATSEAAAPATRVAEKVRLFITAGHSFTAGVGGTGTVISLMGAYLRRSQLRSALYRRRLYSPWKGKDGRGLPAFTASTADAMPPVASREFETGIAMSNMISSAAATPPFAQAGSNTWCAA